MAAFEIIDRGSTPNDNTGDKQRDYLGKINDNFAKAANIQEDNTFAGDSSFNGFMTFGTPESKEPIYPSH